MTDKEATTQAVEAPAPQAGTVAQNTAQAASTETAQAAAEETLTLADAYRLIKELRSEAAKTRKEKKEAETALNLLKEGGLSEADKAAKKMADTEAKLQDLEAKHKQTLLRYEVALMAQRKGIVDPDAAVLFLQSQVDYDEDGKPTNLNTLIDKLAKEKPYLFGAVGSNPTNPNRQVGLTMEQVKLMKPDEINRRWDEVQTVLAAKR
ncbi:MAG: hypothetical protein WCP58_09605 [bacterium]